MRNDLFITERELLEKLPITRRTLYAWRKRGIIPFIRKPGGKGLIYNWHRVQETLGRLEQNRGGE
jgi:predicted site-specific integrase-resolvase